MFGWPQPEEGEEHKINMRLNTGHCASHSVSWVHKEKKKVIRKCPTRGTNDEGTLKAVHCASRSACQWRGGDEGKLEWKTELRQKSRTPCLHNSCNGVAIFAFSSTWLLLPCLHIGQQICFRYLDLLLVIAISLYYCHTAEVCILSFFIFMDTWIRSLARRAWRKDDQYWRPCRSCPLP